MTDVKLTMPVLKKGRRSAEQQAKYDADMKAFADKLKELQREIKDPSGSVMKVSSRGWCYLLEGMNAIDKSEFDTAQSLINTCRKEGLLPLDFTAQDKARSFSNDEDIIGDYKDPKEWVNDWLGYIRKIYKRKNDVAFWESQEYYIQIMVEKIDVKNLFEPICKKYHVRIANARGWSDINSRGKLVEKFREAEEIGLKPVFLYYGDFDPAGIFIVDKIKDNINSLSKSTGWTADNLIVDHFGLSYEFIQANNLTWIDNLKTGSGKYPLDDTRHADHKKDYVQNYINAYGVRKCEANAILPIGHLAAAECEKAIQKYLGEDPFETYHQKLEEIRLETKRALKSINWKQRISELMDDVDNIDLDSILGDEE